MAFFVVQAGAGVRCGFSGVRSGLRPAVFPSGFVLFVADAEFAAAVAHEGAQLLDAHVADFLHADEQGGADGQAAVADFADDGGRDFEGAREGGVVFEVEGLDEAAQEVVRVVCAGFVGVGFVAFPVASGLVVFHGDSWVGRLVLCIVDVQEDVILTIVRGWVRHWEMWRVYGCVSEGGAGVARCRGEGWLWSVVSVPQGKHTRGAFQYMIDRNG